MFFKRLSMAIRRCFRVWNIRYSPVEKINAFFYVLLFYSLRILKRVEFDLVSGRLELDNGRILLTGLNIRSTAYAFMEIFLDDCYHLKGHEGEEVVVLDLGANVGMLLPGLVYYGWRPVRYVGVEPMERNFRELAENVKRFMKPRDCLLVNRALARTGGKKKIFHDWYAMSRSLEFVKSPVKGLKTEEVRTVSFAGLLKTVNARFKNLKKPILIKIDIEGGEWEAKDAIVSFLKQDERAKYVRGELHGIGNEKTAGRISGEFARALEGVFDFKVYPTEVKNARIIAAERRRLDRF